MMNENTLSNTTQAQVEGVASKKVTLLSQIIANKKKIVFVSALTSLFLVLLILMVIAFQALSSSTTTLKGTVVSSDTNQAISDALVTIGELSVATDALGQFEFKNIKTGEVSLKVTATNYEDFEKNYTLNNGILGPSSSQITVSLTPAKTSVVTGQLVGEKIDFSSASVLIDGTSSPVGIDGKFSTKSQPGNKLIRFEGSGFNDISVNIDIQGGENNIGEIQVEEAADIQASVRDSITHLKLPNASVQVTNVLESDISFDSDANLKIKDISVGLEYTIQIDLEGYKTYSTTLTTKPSLNDLFTIDLVQEGKVYFFKNDDKDIQAYESDFDGQNLVQLTSTQKLKPIFEFTKNNTLYFSSDHERVSNKINSRAYLPYRLDLETLELQSLAIDTENVGYILPNFNADIALNLTEDPLDDNVWILETMKLNTTDKKVLAEVNSNTEIISDIRLSFDGNLVTYVVSSLNSAELYTYKLDSQTTRSIIQKEYISIVDISEDSRIVLFVDEQGSLSLADLETNEVKIVKREFDGQNVFFKKNSNSQIYYSVNASPDSEILTSDIHNFDPQNVITIEDAEVSRFFYQNDYLLYITNKGLYMFDPNTPVGGNLVLEGEILYEGSFKYQIED